MFLFLRRLTALGLPLLAAGCFGGQSGDDGDVRGPGLPELPGPGPSPVTGGEGSPVPEHPEEGCEDESVNIDAGAVTVFGKTPRELVAGMTPSAEPFFWVDYDSANVVAAHALASQSTTLHLQFALRAPENASSDDPITQLRSNPTEGSDKPCEFAAVQVPIWLTLTTEDGGLDVTASGYLTFYGPEVAQLQARVSPLDSHGSLALTLQPQVGDQDWSVSAFSVFAELWPGGSAGVFTPELTLTTAEGGNSGWAASPPGPADPPMGALHQITVPDRWETVGVWPRLEQCTPGVVRHVEDRVLGVSVKDVQSALNTAGAFALEVNADETTSGLRDVQARMITTEPSNPELVCVEISWRAQQLAFDVPATLDITSNDAPLTHAELSLAVTARVSPSTSSLLVDTHFERAIEDVAPSVSRADFEEDTGQSLSAVPAEYVQFWWTWFGNVSLVDGSRNATFVVSSPNAQQTSENARQAAEGGPGFGIQRDEAGQLLPGDPIFRATTAD